MESIIFCVVIGGDDSDFEKICCFLNMAELMIQNYFDKPLVRNVAKVVTEQNMANAAADLKK